MRQAKVKRLARKRRKSDEVPGAIEIGRSIRGWSQRQLAKASGVAQSWISQYERGGKTPTMRSLERIAAALGGSVLDLFELADLAIRFRTGESAGGGSGSPRAPVSLRWFPNIGGEIAALLAAEAACTAAPLLRPEWSAETQGELDELGHAMALGRWLRGLSQAELGEAAGVRQTALADYERGRKAPTPGTLERISRALEVSAADLFDLAAVVRRLRSGSSAQGLESASLGRAAPQLWREVGALIAAEVATAYEPAHALMLAALDESRRGAPKLWEALEGLKATDRRALVIEQRRFHDTGFCELLCQESLEAAGDSVERAVELADLAVAVAEQVAGGNALGSRVEGFARFHRANIVRVGSDLPRADRAIERAKRLWQAGAAADPGLLNEARVLGIEASLRRDQRRLPESFALLDRALLIDRWGETPSLLIAKAKALEEVGEYEEAVALLVRAAAELDGERDLRRLFFVHKNTAVNLCHLGRHAEAEKRLPEIRAMAAQLGRDLELVRLSWLEGKVAAGRGRPDEAIAILGRVRGDLVERKIPYDAALVTLELAEVHASLGRTTEVKALARESAPIFQAQGVHREARRALELFREAAEQEAVTADLARRLVAYLYRAEQNPELRFEEAA